MYHIKDDKRCHRSAVKISEAYGELLTAKPLSEISISDIQRQSGVGRATFYRLFDNTDDVLYYIVEKEFRGMVEKFVEMNWRDFTLSFLEAVASESLVLRNINASGKMHIISRSLRTSLTRVAEEGHFAFNSKSKYTIAMFVGCCLSMVSAWDEQGRDVPLDELADLMQNTLNYRKIEAYLSKPAKLCSEHE